MLSRRVGKVLMPLAALLCLLLMLPTAMADSKARIVRLSYVDGDVQIDRAEGQGYEKAIMNMPVVEGAKVWTRDAGARAEIEIENGSTIRLTPESVVAFQQLGLRNSGQRITSVELRKGTAYFDVRRHAGEFRVSADGQQISVPDNSEFRLDVLPRQIEVAVLKGEVKVPSTPKEIKVKKNDTLDLDPSDAAQYTLAKSINAGPFDDWNRERGQYRDTYASANYSGGYSGFSPYYSYGFADLNYYGQSFYAPGWGWMWQPYGIGPGWSPFLDGAWMWYPGPGYLWVSAYPWGWMPYHYGSWNFVPGYGWAWFPGSAWRTWVPYAPIRTAPTGYVAPQPPPSAITAGTTAPAGVPHKTLIVGNGGTTIYPTELGRPGTVLNRNAAIANLQRSTGVAPAGATTVHPSSGKMGATTTGGAPSTTAHTGSAHASGGIAHSSGSSGHGGASHGGSGRH